MLGIKRKITEQYSDKFVEKILGHVLIYRDEIIPNSVFLDKEKELNGMIGFSGRRLSDELDDVAAYYVYLILKEHGMSVDQIDNVLAKLYDRFVRDKIIDASDRNYLYANMTERIHEYLRLNGHARVGAAFMAHVVEGHNALSSDTGRYVEPVLKTLASNIQKIIDRSTHG